VVPEVYPGRNCVHRCYGTSTGEIKKIVQENVHQFYVSHFFMFCGTFFKKKKCMCCL
jgi:hypothetical protein